MTLCDFDLIEFFIRVQTSSKKHVERNLRKTERETGDICELINNKQVHIF